METTNDTPNGLTREQVRVFANGLHYLAAVDGLCTQEQTLLNEFLEETGFPDLGDSVGADAFAIGEAVQILDTSFLRRLFVKTCVLMVQADHQITNDEREALEFIADAFGPEVDLAILEAEVAGQTLMG